MKIEYKIFEIRVIEEKVIFAGYSDGYGRETESIYGFIHPSWAYSSYDTEEDAFEHLKKNCDDNTNIHYEIKKVYREKARHEM